MAGESLLVFDELAVRRVQVQLGAVKTCSQCGRTKPIGAFYVPSQATSWRSWKRCVECERTVVRVYKAKRRLVS